MLVYYCIIWLTGNLGGTGCTCTCALASVHMRFLMSSPCASLPLGLLAVAPTCICILGSVAQRVHNLGVSDKYLCRMCLDLMDIRHLQMPCFMHKLVQLGPKLA